MKEFHQIYKKSQILKNFMAYYPKSQIKTNLYTNGNEYSLSTNKGAYTGYYYKISTGKKYTGKNPNDKPNILLIPITLPNEIDPRISFIATNLNNLITLNNIVGRDQAKEFNFDTSFNPSPSLNTNPRFIPLFNLTLPTNQDIQNGQFTRYFCKKTNELKYLEIDKETHTKLQAKDLQIAWDLYEPASLLWVIKGTQENVFNTNKSSVFKIEQNQRWNGFSQYFKENYSKYYQSQDINDLYTSGGEFTTKNGQNYIGFYHIHNGITPMVGKTHINTPHDVLLPTKKPQLTSQTTSSMMLPTSPTIPSGGGNYSGGGSSMGGGGSY